MREHMWRGRQSGLVIGAVLCLLLISVFGVASIRAAAQAGTTQAGVIAASCDPYEPNESFGWAWAITAGGNYEAKICDATDLDWFKFPVTAGQDIQVRLYDLPADYDVELWDPDETYIDRSNNGGTTSEEINHTATKTGEYRVQVYGYSGAYDATTSYSLRVLVSASPCTDSWEPNETWATAATMPTGIHIGPYICTDTDVDWFKFSVTAGQEIQVSMDSLPANYDVALYDPTGTWKGTSDNTGTADEALTHTAMLTGDYSVRVYGVAGAYDESDVYRLRVDLVTGCTDAWEPNETWATAATMPTGIHIGPYICTDTDVDWFKFSVTAGQEIQVTMDSLPENYDVALYDPSGAWKGTSDNTGTADEALTHTALLTGDYSVRVYGVAGAYDESDVYRLRVDLVTGCTDSWEPNETWETAATMPTGLHIGPYICTDTDVDWFKFSVTAGQQITVTMDSLPANYDVALYDPTGAWKGTSDNTSTADEALTHTAMLTGDYAVRVYGVAGAYDANDTYRLRVDVETVAPTCNDPWEPNDTWGSAASIAINTNVEAYICDAADVDWFAFPVSAGQQITLTLGSLPADYDLRLYSPAGSYIDDSTNAGTASELISHTAATTGDYYAYVFAPANDYDVSDSYLLRAEVGSVATREYVYLPLVRK